MLVFFCIALGVFNLLEGRFFTAITLFCAAAYLP